MNLALADSDKPWITMREERTTALEIVLLQRTYVLPWSQFLYAEGGNDEVRIVFAAHDVILKGSGLEALMADLAAQRVAVVREPSRTNRFSGADGRLIREVVVQRVEPDQSPR